MQPTPSYLLLMHAQLGNTPPVDDGQEGELFMRRGLRTALTVEADDPAHSGIPRCRACSVELAVLASMAPTQLVVDGSTWRFVRLAGE